MSESKAPSAGIKETLTSLMIAFMLAFVFRGFVIEGFQIPTGSMAPTLLGKNVRFHSDVGGYSFTTGPWEFVDRNRQVPYVKQGDASPMAAVDPMTGLALPREQTVDRSLSSGDRVFVLKYLPVLHAPERWDVVVFKDPNTHTNYIKRLVGLPGEQLAIVDGDIHTRRFVEGETARSGFDAWAGGDWRVARKSERVQRAMLLDIFDSRYAPVRATPEFRSPWDAGSGWRGVREGRRYTYEGSGETALEWNGVVPLSDRNAYNQNVGIPLRAVPGEGDLGDSPLDAFWASDLALSASFVLADDGVVLRPEIAARGRVFRAVLDCATGAARLETRARGSEGAAWTLVDDGSFGARGAGDAVGVELWHVDQAAWLFVDGELVCGGAERGGYALSPLAKAVEATGMTRGELEAATELFGDGVARRGVFGVSSAYEAPGVRWSFSGGGFEMSRVRVRRDICYRVNPQMGAVTRGAHPNNFPTMTGEDYFMLGDNSARSLDARYWEGSTIVPWVRETVSDRVGVVHEDLIVGRAFVVYWPSMLREGVVPAPDVGRVRWIF